MLKEFKYLLLAAGCAVLMSCVISDEDVYVDNSSPSYHHNQPHHYNHHDPRPAPSHHAPKPAVKPHHDVHKPVTPPPPKPAVKPAHNPHKPAAVKPVHSPATPAKKTVPDPRTRLNKEPPKKVNDRLENQRRRDAYPY